MSAITAEIEFRHAHFFCGLGGGARGFNRGRAQVGNLRARFRCIGGIDVDKASIVDFERLAGVPGTVMDLFSLEQYVAFHGRMPPAGWREASPEDVRRAFNYERPHIVFLSAPCKGFSGLLAEKQSKTDKYQALNGLTLRGMFLMLEAWEDDLPELIIFENVPRIATRGGYLLDQIEGLLRGYGFAVARTTHNCGEIGNLAQSRERFLLVARNTAKVPNFLYEPPKRPLRGVGEVLDRLPLPGDIAAGGAMHRVPALQWKTWVRLAFVEAGKDWRSLNDLQVEDGFLTDYAIAPETGWQGGVLGVHAWSDATGVVTGRSAPTTGAHSVADPRSEMWGGGQAGVTAWDQSAAVVTGARSPLQNRGAVADPRVDGHPKSVQLGVRPWDRPAPVVKGDVSVGTGPYAVADPRMEGGPRFSNVFRIVRNDAAAPAVTSAKGALAAVADPRGEENRHVNGKYRVTPYDGASNAVIAASTTGNGASAVADPRIGDTSYNKTKYQVTPYDGSTRAVIGASTAGDGTYAVADPRPTHGPQAHTNKMKVVDYQGAAPVVTGSDRVGSGALSVADPRPVGLAGAATPRADHYGVVPWKGSTGAVLGSSHPWDNGRWSVADPRPAGLQGKDQNSYANQAHYGVVHYGQPAGSVTAYGQFDNGRWSVADPRNGYGAELSTPPAAGRRLDLLPGLAEQLVCIIIARDGTWHRPFTTLELAALQSLFDPEDLLEVEDRRKFVLQGQSDSAWRERIGNAVPSAAAEVIASVMGTTLLLAMTGETFSLSNDAIWVREMQIALSVDTSGQVAA